MNRFPRQKLLGWLSIAAASLALLPLRSDGAGECANATTSLASTMNNPVAGDEQFFTLPVGPSNVMFLLDVSGSMKNVPQCGDANAWGDSSALATCKAPSTLTVANPAVGSFSTGGTCDVRADPNLAWMHNYTPDVNTPAQVDPGLGTASNGLSDVPTWGLTCTGNNCLFQLSKMYLYGGWNETSATPVTTCSYTTPAFSYTTYAKNSKGNWAQTTVNVSAHAITADDAACAACVTASGAAGFYLQGWKYAYTYTNSSGTTSTQYVTGSGSTILSGGWLNNNPPKFMSARKVIKQSVWIDPNKTAATDQLRFGLAYVSTAIANNAAIIVPLGPNQANSYPVNPNMMVQARQYVINALNRKSIPSGFPSLLNGGTPMATGLFHVGQYFTAKGTYTNAFGSAYELTPSFAEDYAGLMSAPWVSAGDHSICWSCQKSAVIIVTDGSPNSEMAFPSAIKSYDAAIYTASANCGSGQTANCSTSPVSACCSPSDSTGNPPSYVPRVAAWLHDNDLRPFDLNYDQNVNVSAVSFNLSAGNAQTILQSTANMGGGTFNNAADGKDLASKVAQAVANVATTATSFGAPAASALTTIHTSNTKAFVTRFRPNQQATWEGHVFEFMLFDESAAGCNPAKKPDPLDTTQQVICQGKTVPANFNGDTDVNGYNICTGTFLVDADCDEVVEDQQKGLWYKKGTNQQPAKVFWDAGESLSYRTYPSTSWQAGKTVAGYTSAAEPDATGNIAPVSTFAPPGTTPRNLWTALPDGTMVALETRNATQLAPFMNLSSTWCANLESQAKLCGTGKDASGNALPACPLTSGTDWKTPCAQQVILFARGWDVLDADADGCAGPGNPSNVAFNTMADGSSTTVACGALGEERDRPNDALVQKNTPTFFKLGDIFHSSPVLVHPPVSEGACNYGIDNQCVRTVYGYTSNQDYTVNYQTALDTYTNQCKTGGADVDAYRAWRYASKARKSVLVVGSNDGILHAFDAGDPDTSDPKAVDDDCVPYGTTDGTGKEMWGFVPADLLPRLKDTLLNHQYMVDGNIMVRDVWLDGVANPTGGSLSLDGKKQKGEFHTLAVFTERAGGTQFTALDITDVSTPKLLWTFPPPLSADAQWMGQSWSDFSPRPPPVGPVRLAVANGDPDPQKKGWLERWIVMVNGGYDPTLTRGRAVWMLDVGTGKVLWRFTDADFKAKLGFDTSAGATSMFPVPAAVGLVDIGDPAKSPLDSDNFFDTATWGDLGGNLFVARFDYPGQRDATTGLVTNWRAARTFEEDRRTSDAQFAPNRSEFYYMTSNVYEPQRHTLHTQVGSGNRERILETTPGCAPDDLFSCCQSGCTVSTSSSNDYGVCSSSSSFSCSGGQMTSLAPSSTCGSGATACTGATNTFKSTASYNLNCGTSTSTTAGGSSQCDQTGLCSVSPVGTGHDLVPSGTTCKKSRFYGIWAYGGLPGKTFSTDPTKDWTTAKTFDTNRFTDVDYTGCTFTSAGKCSLVDVSQVQVSKTGAITCASGTCRMATVDDPGWYYSYNTGPCPTAAACGTGCTHERTASSGTVTRSCTTWNSFLPLGSASSGTDPCSGAGIASQIAVGYASNFVTGAPDLACNEGFDSSTIYRGQQRSTIAPPSAPMVRYGISPLGQVHYSAVQFDPGRAPTGTSMGTRDIMESLYWLEVDRGSHACRHGNRNSCE